MDDGEQVIPIPKINPINFHTYVTKYFETIMEMEPSEIYAIVSAIFELAQARYMIPANLFMFAHDLSDIIPSGGYIPNPTTILFEGAPATGVVPVPCMVVGSLVEGIKIELSVNQLEIGAPNPAPVSVELHEAPAGGDLKFYQFMIPMFERIFVNPGGE